jgi:hypothetical protein
VGRAWRGGPYLPGPWGGLQFPALDGFQLKSARLFSGGEVKVASNNRGFVVDVPSSARQAIVTTVELSLDGETLPVQPLSRVASLTTRATLTASHNPAQLKNLTDQKASTNWEAVLDHDQHEMWVEASFEKPVTIASFNVARGDAWSPRHTVEIQVPDGSSGWKSISPKRLMLKWETMKFLDAPVTTDRIRLHITDTKKFVFAEFELFPPVD